MNIIRTSDGFGLAGPDDQDIPLTDVDKSYSHQPVVFETDRGTLEPIVVDELSGDSIKKSSQLHSVCGGTEMRSSGSTGYQLSISGILTENQVRGMRAIGLQEGTNVTINTPLWQDEYTIGDISWTKPDSLNCFYSEEYPDGVQAYTFQIQTKNPEQNNG